jgi:hypothetical protein
MRTNVTFEHPAKFIPVSGEDGVLAVDGASWFVLLLERIPDLRFKSELCQEDWGVVVFAERNQSKFWIGLGMWPDSEHAWLAHFHHGVYSWLQRFTSSGKTELQRLVVDFHNVLLTESTVRKVVWYEERKMRKANPDGSAVPL